MAWCWGIGKGKVVKGQKAGHTLPSIFIVSASQAEVRGQLHSWRHVMEEPSPVMNGVHRTVWKS